MRALIVFLLVALSFAMVVLFYPESTTVEGAPATRPGTEGPQLPTPPQDGEEPVRGFLAREDRPQTAPAPEPAAVEERAGLPSWLAGVEVPADPVDENEMELAAALLHGTPQEVFGALGRANLASDRLLLARSFSTALAGEVHSAIRLAGDIDESALSPLERSLLQEALGGEASPQGVSRADWNQGGLVRAMGMSLASARANRLMQARRHGEAARLLSDLLLSELDAPWRADRGTLVRWTELLDEAQRHHRWHPRGEWPGIEIVVESGDSAISIRRRYLSQRPGSVVCAGLILRANAVTGYLQPGQRLRIPTEQVSVLVDLGARWALYLIGEDVAGSWPVGIGRPGEETRTGVFRAGNKIENPPWMKVGQAIIPYGDPDNPLGTRWIGWFDEDIKTSYGFHGTWRPESIGEASSDGCVRFLNEDVEVLFEILPDGAPILVRP